MWAGSIAGITPGEGGTGDIGLEKPGWREEVGSSLDIAGNVDTTEEEEDIAKEVAVVADIGDDGPSLIVNP